MSHSNNSSLSMAQERSEAAGGVAARWTMSEVALFAGVAVALFVGLHLFYSSFYSVHQDLAGSALSGRLALMLGDQFAEYSLYFPPVERIWFSFAASLSELTGLRLDLVTIAMTGLAVLLSVGLAFHIRKVSVGASPLFLVGSLVLLTVIPVLYKNVFGLREHLVVLGLWPYIVLRVSDPQNTKIGWQIRTLVGLWLGATLLFKYLYCLAVLLVELADAACLRNPLRLFRIENVISGAFVALYLLLWIGLDPLQREVMAAIVTAIDANLSSTATNIGHAAIHIAPAILFVLLGIANKVPPRVTAIGLGLVVAAIIASWIQARWYSHHLFPITMAYLAWIWMIHREAKLLWLVGLTILVCRPLVFEFANTRGYQASVSELDLAMDASGLSLEGRRVGLLTMHPSPFNQHLAAHGAARWNNSMNNSYVASELKPLDTPENQGITPAAVKLDDPGVQMLHNELLRLWEDQPPEYLILDESSRWPLRYIRIRWTQAFAEDDRFNAVLDGYEKVYLHDGERTKFTVYQRID
ncbi:MAG: hypothetical protein AAGL10_12550 [Pseudomonadota bacterium]